MFSDEHRMAGRFKLINKRTNCDRVLYLKYRIRIDNISDIKSYYFCAF